MTELLLLANTVGAVLTWAADAGITDAEGNLLPGYHLDPLPVPLMIKGATYDENGDVVAPPVYDDADDFYSNLLLSGDVARADTNPAAVDEDGFDQSLLRVWFRNNGTQVPRESKNPDFTKTEQYYRVTYPLAPTKTKLDQKTVTEETVELIWPVPAARKRVWAT